VAKCSGVDVIASVHLDLFGELIEWVEDVAGVKTAAVGSQCLLVRTPAGWGSSGVLDAVEAWAAGPAGADVMVLRVDGRTAPTLEGQLDLWLQSALAEAVTSSGLAARLGVESFVGIIDRGVGAADALGLLGGRPASLLAFATSLGLSFAATTESGKLAIRAGMARRKGAQLARFSSSQFPTVVLVDDAHLISAEFFELFASATVMRPDGRVLVVAAHDPSEAWERQMLRVDRSGVTAERFTALRPPARMGLGERLGLAQALLPAWTDDALDALASSTVDFAEVVAVAGSATAGDVPSSSQPSLAATEICCAVLSRRTSDTELVLSWLGGRYDTELLREAVRAAGLEWSPDGLASLGRVATHVNQFRFAQGRHAEVARLASRHKRLLIEVVARSAATTLMAAAADPLLRIAQLAPLWHLCASDEMDATVPIRIHLKEYAELLVKLGDLDEASLVADFVARRELRDRRGGGLSARTASILAAVGDRESGFAVDGVQARLASAVAKCHHPGHRRTGIEMIEADLPHLANLGTADTTMALRLQIADALVQANRLQLAGEVLRPLLAQNASSPHRRLAELVLDAGGEPGQLSAYLQLLLERREQLGPNPAPEDLRPVVSELADVLTRLGNPRAALVHLRKELECDVELLGPDHPSTLAVRYNIGVLIACAGTAAAALDLHEELLPDLKRVLGPDHPNTLHCRGSIAVGTANAGDRAKGVELCKSLLPDLLRVVGPDDPRTLDCRHTIAAATVDPRRSLELCEDLLPDLLRVLGPDHQTTLHCRDTIAAATVDPRRSLELCEDLLPDLLRVLGPDHSQTVRCQVRMAVVIGQICGHQRELELLEELLPDLMRVLGPDHTDTLICRHNIAVCTADVRARDLGLKLSEDLLPDLLRVLGPDHHATLACLNCIEDLRNPGGPGPIVLLE
jgi:hypothetical protein